MANDLPAPLIGGAIIVAVILGLAFVLWLNGAMWSTVPQSTTTTEQTLTPSGGFSPSDARLVLVAVMIFLIGVIAAVAYLFLRDRR